MTEDAFRNNTVLPALRHFGMAVYVENRINSGTPDLAACLRIRPASASVSSWIELKHAYAWPVHPKTFHHFNHFDIDQVNWLERWDSVGGRCCIVAQVARDYMLIPAKHVREVFVGANKATYIKLSAVHGHGVFPTGKIVKWLTGN